MRLTPDRLSKRMVQCEDDFFNHPRHVLIPWPTDIHRPLVSLGAALVLVVAQEPGARPVHDRDG